MTDIIRGTEVKFNLNIEPIDNISMDDYDFLIYAYCKGSAQRVEVPKSDCTEVDNDNYTIPIDTSGLSLGQMFVDIHAYVPDNEFPDGFRTEIIRIETELNVIQ